MKRTTLLLLSLVVVLCSCIKDLNLDPDFSIKYPGNWALPIVHVKMDLGDFVVEDSLFSTDPSGLVHIIYKQDSLFSQNVYDYTKVPKQDPLGTDFSTGSPDINISTNLGTFGGAKMDTISLSSGLLSWKAINDSAYMITLNVKIKNSSLNGAELDFNLIAAANSTSTGTIDVSNLLLDLTQGTPAYNNIGFEVSEVNDGGAPSGTTINLELEFENLAIKRASGFFGERNIELPSGKFDADLGALSNFAQGLYLANPQVKIFTKSNIGLPLKISADLLSIGKKGNSVDLELAPFNFSGSKQRGTYAYDTILINNGNSSISNFIANIPESFIYSGMVEINPDGELDPNFVTENGELLVGMEVDLPLELSTKDLTIEQHIYDIDFGVDDSEYDFVERLTLGFRVENGFPLDADMNIYFLDTSGTLLDSAIFNIFDAADVDINGNVTNSSKKDVYYDFEGESIKNILKSEEIFIKIVLNTSNNGNQTVRLLTTNYIDLIIGANAKMNYEL